MPSCKALLNWSIFIGGTKNIYAKLQMMLWAQKFSELMFHSMPLPNLLEHIHLKGDILLDKIVDWTI